MIKYIKHYKIVFIIGCQRSGTTLIGNILGARPNAFLIDEKNEVYPWLYSVLKGDSELKSEKLFLSSCISARSNYLNMDKRCYPNGQIKSQISHLILKVPNLAYFADQIAEKFNSQYLVYSYRDIRDIVVSMGNLSRVDMVSRQLSLIQGSDKFSEKYRPLIQMLEQGNTPGHLARAIIGKIKTELKDSFHNEWINKIEVPYESLVCNSDKWISSICRHVKLSPCLNTDSHLNEMSGFGPGLTYRMSIINDHSVGQWQQFLSTTQEADIWALVGPLMEGLGYQRQSKQKQGVPGWSSIQSVKKHQPIIASGRGGSGTRLLSELLQSLGVFLGNRLNVSGDSVEWVALSYKIAANHTSESLKPGLWRHHMQANATKILKEHQWDGVQNWGWKLPEIMLILPEVIDAFNQSRFIHFVRHPVDCSLRRSHMTSRIDNFVGSEVLEAAYKKLNWSAERIQSDPQYLRNAASWLYQVNRASEYGRNLLNSKNYHVIRYEDLCTNQEQEILRLADFLKTKIPTGFKGVNIDARRQKTWSPSDSRAEEVWDICGELALEFGYQNMNIK